MLTQIILKPKATWGMTWTAIRKFTEINNRALSRFFIFSLLFLMLPLFAACAEDEDIIRNEPEQEAVIDDSKVAPEEAQKLKTKFHGKRISLFGNSRCTFSGYMVGGNRTFYPRGDVNSVSKTWWWMVLDYVGAVLDSNNSYSAGRITNTHPVYPDYLSRVDRLGSPDFIFLWGGVNDQNNGVAIGPVDFLTPYEGLDQGLFAPALIKLIIAIRDSYANAEIIMFIEDNLNDDYVDAIKNIASHFELEVVDLSQMATSKLDALHYNAKGMTQLANEVVRQLIEDNSQTNDENSFH